MDGFDDVALYTGPLLNRRLLVTGRLSESFRNAPHVLTYQGGVFIFADETDGVRNYGEVFQAPLVDIDREEPAAEPEPEQKEIPPA
jgi:hypothetical protein